MSGSAIASAEALCERGEVHEALRLLTESNRVTPDPAVELSLVRLRHEGFSRLHRTTTDFEAPTPARSLAGGEALPEMSAGDLTPDSLRRGFAQHGCVLVRGLVPASLVEPLVAGIDSALEALDAGLAGASVTDTEPWFVPFEPGDGNYRVGGRRNWVRKSGAMWTADSPRMLFELVELIDVLGIGKLVTDYLGERPALSANKCTLRRTPVGANSGDWHQDGAFLGQAVRTVNFWLALEHCGVDAPGLDIVPRRLGDVVETGTGGAHFDWAVGPETVADVAEDTPPIRPVFAPGDALLFDHLFLHRTAMSAEMRRERHAIETWFFAPSTYPEGQIPLVY